MQMVEVFLILGRLWYSILWMNFEVCNFGISESLDSWKEEFVFM